MALLVRSVILGDGYVEIAYMKHPEDIRADTTLMQTHVLTIDTDKGDYGDERDAVEDAVRALLLDALEDFDSSPNPGGLGDRPE